MQIKAGFKKEWMLFSRTFKMFGVALAIFAFAVIDPIMYKALDLIMAELEKVAPTISGENSSTGEANEISLAIEEQMEQTSQTEQAAQTSQGENSSSFMNSMSEVMGGTGVAVGFYGAAAEITTTSTLIILLLLMAAAGGEQKKRSTIIPDCAGLSPKNYILPKFILYPLFTGVATFLAIILSYFVSQIAFSDTMPMSNVFLAAACGGIYQGFIVTLFLLFGICTSRPGVGTIIIYISTSIIPIILQSLKADKYNPFSLKSMMMENTETMDTTNLWVSILVTVVLCVIMYLLTLVVLTARKIDNSGAEAEL